MQNIEEGILIHSGEDVDGHYTELFYDKKTESFRAAREPEGITFLVPHEEAYRIIEQNQESLSVTFDELAALNLITVWVQDRGL